MSHAAPARGMIGAHYNSPADAVTRGIVSIRKLLRPACKGEQQNKKNRRIVFFLLSSFVTVPRKPVIAWKDFIRPHGKTPGKMFGFIAVYFD